MLLDQITAMRIAIPDWQGRISPVFDVATHLLLADVEDGSVRWRQTVPLKSEDMQMRVQEVCGLGIELLICGAISRPLELALIVRGIEVSPQTCGEVEEVLSALLAGSLHPDAFLMPGCCGRRRRFHGQDRHRFRSY